MKGFNFLRRARIKQEKFTVNAFGIALGPVIMRRFFIDHRHTIAEFF
jgi:hypothetical protein